MKRMTLIASGAALAVLSCAAVAATNDPVLPKNMTFFLTSVGAGDGGNLGGLAGADRHCGDLAKAAGAPQRQWRAYLSADAAKGISAVNARDRIGRGPWYNAKGAEVGKSVADLHRPGSPINRETVLDEKGNLVNGRGDTPNRHDILTGSNPDGTLARGLTCSSWTSNAAGATRVGHFDRTGGGENPLSWNSAHPSKSCALPDLRATGGDGLFYCFAGR